MAATQVVASASSVAASPSHVAAIAATSSAVATPVSSKKQEHLNAGRRRLEEFKQKKRAEKSKVSASGKQNNKQTTGQVVAGVEADGYPPESETVRDLSTNFERANGAKVGSYDGYDLSSTGKTLQDNQNIAMSLALPSDKPHSLPWEASLSVEKKIHRDTSSNVDSQFSKKLIDEDRPFSWPSSETTTFPQSYAKQDVSSMLSISHPDSAIASVILMKDPLLPDNTKSGSVPLNLNTYKKGISNYDMSASFNTSVNALGPTCSIISDSTATSLSTNSHPSVEHNRVSGLDKFFVEVTGNENSSLSAAPGNDRQLDNSSVLRAGDNALLHDPKTEVHEEFTATMSQTVNAQITPAKEFTFSDYLPHHFETLLSQVAVPPSLPSDSRSTNHSSPFQQGSFHASSKSLYSSSPPFPDALRYEIPHTYSTAKLEPHRRSPQLAIPVQVSTSTANQIPFSSVLDSVLNQPQCGTAHPPISAKIENKVDGGKQIDSSQLDSGDIAHSFEANHPYARDKFPSSGSVNNLRPSFERPDEFASLEQHIEDLTREKFSLQRSLDAARALAESLAKENTALTEDFNQQGALITDLKSEVERQQSELHAQELVLNTSRAERDKAQQESNLAVVRSQALAEEVVSLEERILKVRSQELKLEKEVKTLMAENESQRSQISSIEKDRTNLRSLIEALQEEKKVLQSRLRKATSTPIEDVHKSLKETVSTSAQAPRRADASTSTDDLDIQESFSPQGVPLLPGSSSQPGSSVATSHASNNVLVPNPWSSIPSEHLRKIENINMLITELAEEKDALLKTLKAESSAAVELRALNAELSRKLEYQTQQLELAVAQRMAYEGNTMTRNNYEAAAAEPEFVDEGDEVVERVLGWIMKLFPGGSSKRSGSKHL